MRPSSSKPALTPRQNKLLLALGLGSTLLCLLAITNFFTEGLLQRRYLMLYLLMAGALLAMLRIVRSMRRQRGTGTYGGCCAFLAYFHAITNSQSPIRHPMKKMFFVLCLALIGSQVVVAQIKLPGTGSALQNFIAPPSFTDAGKTASGIADLLGSKLSLNGDQQKSTLDAVTGFLAQKKGILGLASSNPADYLKKFNPLQQGLFGKLKTIMGAAKFANFLKLKPSGTGAGNLLSNLFF